MQRYLKRAKELESEIVENRRKIHQFGGIGFDIQETSDFVFEKLQSYGLHPQRMCGTGIVCTIGSGGKTILLRADMDALPIQEDTGLPFACQNGTAHACGHDMHTAMLLAAAKMLSETQDELKGTVKLMFQPAEEALKGATAMMKAGVLENPKVDAAFAIHVTTGHENFPTGSIQYVRGVAFGSCDMFRITVKGKECHGAYPCRGIDPINIGSRIVTATQELVSMELPATEEAVITFGKFHSGEASNIIPSEAVLDGTIRTLSKEARTLLKTRFKEIVEQTAATFRGQAIVEYPLETGFCITDPDLFDQLKPTLCALAGEEMVQQIAPVNGSEDFGPISEIIPTVYVWMGAGTPSEGYPEKVHSPRTKFSESVLPLGAAIHATVAVNWLAQNA